MKNFLLIIVCSIYTLPSYASVKDIEQDLTNCLKGKYLSWQMQACSLEAYEKCEAEIMLLFRNNALNNKALQYNQTLWNDYKKSVRKSVINPLNSATGSLFQEFAASNLYYLEHNRLIILGYYLKDCNYQTENNRYEKQITKYLAELKNYMTDEQYSLLLKNQKDWQLYKNNTIALLPVKKEQVSAIMTQERNSQLFSLLQIYAQ